MNPVCKRRAADDVPCLIAFGIYLTIAVLQSSFYKSYLPKESRMNALLLVLMLFLAAREIRCSYMNAGSALLLVTALILCASALRIGTVWTAFPFLLIFFCRDISVKRLFTVACACLFLLLLFIILSSRAGIILNYKRVESTRENHREYLGFLYALHPGTLYFTASALLLVLRGRRTHWVTYAALFAGSCLLFRKTDGRLSFFLTCALIAAFLLAKLVPGLFRALAPLTACVIPLIPLSAAVSFLLALRYNGSVRWMSRLNTLLGRRLEYSHRSLLRFGFGLLGRRVKWVGYGLNEQGLPQTGDYLYVDNMYVNFLQRYGILAALAVLLTATVALLIIYRARRYELLLVFALIAVHGLIDDRMLYLAYNTFWIAAAHALAATHTQEAYDYESIL